MTAWKKWFGHRKPSQNKKKPHKQHKPTSLGIELLEARITPADVLAGSLLFRGNLLENNGIFTVSNSAVEVGYNPTVGENFRPLVTLTGNTLVDPLNQQFQFQGSGTFAGKDAPITFWNSTTLSTVDVQDLVGTGETITGAPFSLGNLITTATTLAFTNPNEGDTSDSTITLGGNGTLAFGAENNGTRPGAPLDLSNLQWTVNGPGAGVATGKASGSFYAAATTWTIASDNINTIVTNDASTTTITGAANTTIRTDQLSATLDGGGLTITNGQLTGLDAKITGAMTFAGCAGQVSGSVTWADATLNFNGTGSARTSDGPEGLFDYDNLKFTIAQNSLTSLTAKTTTGIPGVFSLNGINVFAVQLTSKLSIDSATQNESLKITGTIDYSGDNLRTNKQRDFTLTLAGDGLVIRDGGIKDWDGQIDGRLDLATNSFEARAIRVWHKSSDNSYGFSGVLYLTLDGFKKFTKGDKVVFSEPSNFISVDCGTKEKPGVLFVNGELRRVDVALSTKNGLIDLGGFTFRINNLGLVYEATEGGGTRTWGLFGALSLNTRSYSLKLGDQGVAAGVSLGTRANPGLLLTSEWNQEAQQYVSKIALHDFSFRLTGLYIGPLRISEAEFQYKTNTTNPDLETLKITLACSFKGIMLGGSITFKDVFDETTKTYSKQVDGFSVKGGADPGANKVDTFKGIPIAPGVFLYQIEGIVENLASPENLIITGIATFSIGPTLPGVFKDNGKVINTPVHTGIVRGTISWSGQKIWGNVDMFLVAYWDEANYAAHLEPWKPLAGKGTGTFLIDWGNNIYEVKFNATLVSLVHGDFHLKITDQGIMVYASIRVNPTPYGPFDFWPLNEIDVTGTCLYLSTEEHHVFGAWAKVRIFGFNWTGGAGYDYTNEDGFLMDSDDVAEFMRWKEEFLESSGSAYKLTQTYTVQAPQGSSGVYASRITSTIPFVTSDIFLNNNFVRNYQFAMALTTNDILVEVPTGSATNALPNGASFTYRVEMSPPNPQGYTTGSIIVDIFANSDKTLDYSKTFSMLGVDKVIVDLKVRLKQNSFLYNSGANQNTYMDAIEVRPENFLKGYDFTKSGSAIFANCTWDSTRKVSVGGQNLPLIPEMSTTVFLADPTISLTNGQLISAETNSFTNTTSFSFQANPFTTTQARGTVSLMVLDDFGVLANRWLVQQSGAWAYDSATGYVAPGFVVEQNRFNQFEIIANRTDLPFTGGAESVGLEVLYFNSTRDTVKGVIKAVGTNSVSIEAESGGRVEIPREQVKPLWTQKVRVMLRNSQFLGTNPGQVFEAANVPTGYAEAQATGTGKNYYELFNTHSAIRLGNLTTYNSNSISRDWVKLPTLPHFVSDRRAELGENGINQFFPIDANTGLTTMEAGNAVPLVGLNGSPVSASSIVGLNQFPSTVGGTFTWSEKGLNPTAKWAYLMIDDGINPPAYSGFSRFTPSVQVTGKALVKESEGIASPYNGLTVYIDTNLNGKFDSPEAFDDKNYNGSYDLGEPFVDLNANTVRDNFNEPNTVTNTEGVYYFYDVAAGTHTIGFDLPGNRTSLAGGPASITIIRGTEPITQVVDFTALMVFPLLKGRVTVDANQNGKEDPGEPGFNQAWVVVTGAGGRSIRTLTDNDGYYSIPVDDETLGSTLTVSLGGGALNPNVMVSSTVAEKGSNEITPVEYLNPRVFTTNFFVQANYEFNFDPNASPFENIFNYFQLFINGQYTGVSLRSGGFEFHVDRFKLLPFEAESQGLETARGRVVIQGQTLNFELKGPRGLVSNGPKLLELNAAFSGKFNIFGAKLDVDNLAVRYVAENTTTGTPARFMLTGTTSLEIDGSQVSVELPGEGLVLSNGGIESLNIKLTAGLKIAGYEFDTSTLAAEYNRATDKLTLTGSTKLLQFGSMENGNYIGLENVVVELGGVNNLGTAKVLRLEGTVAAGLSLEGAQFSIDRLTVRYQFEQAALQILGMSTLTVGENTLEITLAAPGIQIANGALTLNASAQGQIVAGGYTFKLENSSIVYEEGSVKFAATTSLNAGQDRLAMASGEIVWKNNAISKVTGKVSGTTHLGQATLELENLSALLNIETDTLNLNGSFKIGWLAGESTDPWVRVAGSIGLVGGTVVSASGKVESGAWEAVPGFTIQMNGLNFEYKSQEQSYRLYGACTATLLGGTVGVSIAEPGWIWRNGSFESFGGGLTGTLLVDLDKNNNTDLELTVENLGFLYEVSPLRLTIHGGIKARLDGIILAGGSLRTDSQGIVFGANGLEYFSLLGSIGANFGESFEDQNKNFIHDTNEPYTDVNGNSKYDIGLAFHIADAGLSYSQAQNDSPANLKLSGMARLAFDISAWEMNADAGVSVDLTNPGITIVDGEIKDFSVVVGANFRIGGVDFQPEGLVGLRYLSGPDQWDLFGKVNAKISDVGYGLAFGDSLDNPGIRWVHGAITRADAAIAGSVTLGEFEATLKDAGFTWDITKSRWGVFGSAKVSVGVWIEASLGTRSNPGLLVDTSKPFVDGWDLNGLELAFGGVNVGGFKLEETRFGFTKVGESFTLVATCGLTVNGWGLAGKFAFKDGMVNEIIVEARTMINIPSTPIFINQFNGSIRNIDFLDLSKLTFTAQVGILVGSEVDLTGVPIIGGKYALAQFFGTAIISANGLRVQADAYILGKEEGPIGARKWKGLLAQGTAGITLDWSRNEYFADVDLRTIPPGILPVFEIRLRGRMTFDGNGMGLSLQAGGTLQLHNLIPILGEMELGGANFYLEIYPTKHQVGITAWFTYKDPFNFFRDKDAGLHWDIWNNRVDLLDDQGVKSILANTTSQTMSLLGSSQPMAQLTPTPQTGLSGGSGMTRTASTLPVHTYQGQSSPVPETEVVTGEYLVHFRVDDSTLRASHQSWLPRLNFQVDPQPGLEIVPINTTFDPTTGLGTIGVRVSPPAGQYLPRGMVLSSKLTSTIILAGIHPELPTYNTEPDMEANWLQAFEYSGNLPATGTDSNGQTIASLNVTRARYLFSFKPQAIPNGALPADWLQSIRIYVEPIPGCTAQVRMASYDAEKQLGQVEVTFRPEGSLAIGGKYIASNLIPRATIRSKVELVGSDESFGSLASPDVTAIWWAEPSEIEAPIVPETIGTDLITTRISGRVHDPRFEEVLVGLFFSLDEAGDLEFQAPLANGEPAIGIPARVQADGSWSVDVTWDPTKLPSGNLWLYGWVDDNGPNPPIYGDSTPFTLHHDIEGTVSSPLGYLHGMDANTASYDPLALSPASGVRVFADLNSNGKDDIGEPVTFTDQSGHYLLNVEGHPSALPIVFVVPSQYSTGIENSSRQVVDLTQGPVTANLQLIPNNTILRGRVKVTGDLGQAVSGIGVIATGPNGSTYRVATDLQGLFEIPVTTPGEYQVNLDLKDARFYDFRVRALPSSGPTRVLTQSKTPEIIRLGDIAVDTVGIVKVDGENAQATLQTLVRQANEGFITSIEFDSSFQNKTITLTGNTSPLDPSYILWNTQTDSWTFVPPSPPLGPDGNPDDSSIYGPSAFRILDTLRIDGGNLGITLQGDGTFRAFHVRPDVQFTLANMTLSGFTSLGANGRFGISAISGLAAGASGGGAGLGGAILNQGNTTISNVRFMNNGAIGGNGGDALAPAFGMFMKNISEGGAPFGQNGDRTGTGGAGGGYLAGSGGTSTIADFSYTLPNDPDPLNGQVIMSGAGGGGSGLGGAIYNASSAQLTILGNTVFHSNFTQGGQGGDSPKFVTNISNSIAGDDAQSLEVFLARDNTSGTNGSSLGQALFNDGGRVVIAPSVMRANPIPEFQATVFNNRGSLAGMPKVMPTGSTPVVVATGHGISILKTDGHLQDFPVKMPEGTNFRLATLDTSNTPVAVAAPGTGSAPILKIMDLATGRMQREIQVFDAGFQGGVFLDTADMDGDGVDEFLLGAGPGGGPHVKLLRSDGSEMLSFFAFAPEFRGGTSVAFVDTNNDGIKELVVGAGPGGGPHVKIFSANGTLLSSFFAFDVSFTGGLFIAAGDLGGDDRVEIILGAGTGGAPHVRILDALTLEHKSDFMAFDASFLGGVRVSLQDYDMDGRLDLVAGAGPGGGPHVKIFHGGTFEMVDQFFATNLESRDGVFV